MIVKQRMTVKQRKNRIWNPIFPALRKYEIHPQQRTTIQYFFPASRSPLLKPNSNFFLPRIDHKSNNSPTDLSLLNNGLSTSQNLFSSRTFNAPSTSQNPEGNQWLLNFHSIDTFPNTLRPSFLRGTFNPLATFNNPEANQWFHNFLYEKHKKAYESFILNKRLRLPLSVFVNSDDEDNDDATLLFSLTNDQFFRNPNSFLLQDLSPRDNTLRNQDNIIQPEMRPRYDSVEGHQGYLVFEDELDDEFDRDEAEMYPGYDADDEYEDELDDESLPIGDIIFEKGENIPCCSQKSLYQLLAKIKVGQVDNLLENDFQVFTIANDDQNDSEKSVICWGCNSQNQDDRADPIKDISEVITTLDKRRNTIFSRVNEAEQKIICPGGYNKDFPKQYKDAVKAFEKKYDNDAIPLKATVRLNIDISLSKEEFYEINETLEKVKESRENPPVRIILEGFDKNIIPQLLQNFSSCNNSLFYQELTAISTHYKSKFRR